MSCKVLDLTAWKWDEAISFEEIENALPKQIRYYADMVSKIETVSEVNAFIAVLTIVLGERRENSKLYAGGIAIFLNGADDLDSTFRTAALVVCFNYFSKCALAEQP